MVQKDYSSALGKRENAWRKVTDGAGNDKRPYVILIVIKIIYLIICTFKYIDAN